MNSCITTLLAMDIGSILPMEFQHNFANLKTERCIALLHTNVAKKHCEKGEGSLLMTNLMCDQRTGGKCVSERCQSLSRLAVILFKM